MKPIRILTPTLDLLAEIDNYESLLFTRRWHEVGEFELRINRHKRHTDKLLKGNLVLLGSELNKVGIIKHREISLDENGKQSETWVIRGVELKGVLAQRIIIPPSNQAYDKINSDAETVMKHFIDAHVVNPTDVNRKIDVITVATNQNRGPTLSWQSRFGNLAEELAKISLNTGIGWEMSLDYTNKLWVFDVNTGRDCTVNQSNNPPVIFSPAFDSIKEIQFTDSDFNYKNHAYVGGQGEGIGRRIVEIGSSNGLDRTEVFIDARDVEEADDAGNPLPESTIVANLIERGNQKLAEMSTDFYLEGRILTNSPFKYGIDYDLGYIVTIQNKNWNVTRDARITEIKEIYEPSGFQIEATFGESRPTLVRKLKQELAQISGEVRK